MTEKNKILDEDEFKEMTFEEKSDYLEGKLDILSRNSMEREKAWRKESERIREERTQLREKMEMMKKEIARLKEEVREGRLENRMSKRIKEEQARNTLESIVYDSQQANNQLINIDKSRECVEFKKNPSNQVVLVNHNVNAHRKTSYIGKSITEQKIEDKTKTMIISNKEHIHVSRGNHQEITPQKVSRYEASNVATSSGLPIEWILSHFTGEIVFGLSGLSPSKLKVFGRFFKREFDSLYNKEDVLTEIKSVGKNTKHLIKCLLYLFDRPEIVSHLLPYVFMKHIVPDGKLYVKEIVHIMYRVGITPVLMSEDTIENVKKFFIECRDSEELMFLVETFAKKSPRGISRLISEEYIIYIAKSHKETAFRIINLLNGCGTHSSSTETLLALHSADNGLPYKSFDNEYIFFL